ncbi:adenylate cyclase regulatory protein-like protein [Leishmania donovani]|uniref:Adenylate_cyclase_regulatory_protein-like_protein /GeneDB:LmjF.05.1220 n=1 Tax=Leishmania donovani TaxID=5661 RepID=A0A504XVF6_LEIDO|nr:Leucine Rich repeats (2 copies) family protein [Leishmania donovani]CAJ1986096.1 adenylate cyclase regulatory protein-like protein [Leishmania donovani]VDZ41996.1 adenylate_cyclase_regulatory_protein-like_protein/GeneDB:LmjF.05.1220 [Leishmania donovani]
MLHQNRHSVPESLFHVSYEPSTPSSTFVTEATTPIDDAVAVTPAQRGDSPLSPCDSRDAPRSLVPGDLSMHRSFFCYVCCEPLFRAMSDGVCDHHVREACCLKMSVSGTATCPLCGWNGPWSTDGAHSECVRDAIEVRLKENAIALLRDAYPALSSDCVGDVVGSCFDRSCLTVDLHQAQQYLAAVPPDGVGAVCTSLGAPDTIPNKAAVFSLRVEGPWLTSCDLVRRFLKLQVLVLCDCADLVSLRGVECAPLLERLTVERCGLADTLGIDACPCLKFLQLRECPRLSHLGWSQIPNSQSSLQESSGQDGGCAALRSVSVFRCPAFRGIGVLSASPHLREFRAQCARISSLAALRECRRLELLDVGGCQQVCCIEALRSAKALRYLDLSNTAVSDIGALSQCTALERVNLNGCLRLRSLDSLECCTELRELQASRTSIETLIGLRLCRALKKVDVSGCAALRDAAALTHLSQLTHVDLSFTAVDDVSSLAYYNGLESVRLRGCRHVRDYSPPHNLEDAPPLRSLDLTNTSVCSISEWGRCPPRLEMLRMNGCTELSDISVLQSASRLRVVDLDNTSVRSVSPLRLAAPELEELHTNDVTYQSEVPLFQTTGVQRQHNVVNAGASSRSL